MGYIKDNNLRIVVFEAIAMMIFTYGYGCAAISTSIAQPPNPVLISCSLLAAIAICAEITDAHVNPILSVAAHVNQRSKNLVNNIVGQFVGGILGVGMFWIGTGKTATPIDISVHDFDDVKVVLNEFFGSFFFSIAVLVATNHSTSYAVKSWQMYLSIITSYFLVRLMAGQTTLNPAIAIPYQILSAILNNVVWWKCVYLVIPGIIGGALGGLTMKKLYEPLLLYTKFNRQLEIQSQNNSEQ